MKKIGIFGAGQAGIMVAKWLPNDQEVVCFIDNNEKKQGTTLEEIPVLSFSHAIKLDLDVIWIAILNKEARKSILRQIKEGGFLGEVINIEEMKERMDVRLCTIRLLAQEIKKRNIPGEMAELGVFQGELAKEMNRLLPEKKLYLFDTFSGFHEKDIAVEQEKGTKRASAGDFSDTSMALVKEKLPYPKQAIFYKGHFPESLKGLREQLPRFSLVSLDPDLYEPVYQGLSVFYPQLNPGGAIVIHDYNSVQFPGVKKAVERYCEEHNLFVVPLGDLHGSAVLMKQG